MPDPVDLPASFAPKGGAKPLDPEQVAFIPAAAEAIAAAEPPMSDDEAAELRARIVKAVAAGDRSVDISPWARALHEAGRASDAEMSIAASWNQE